MNLKFLWGSSASTNLDRGSSATSGGDVKLEKPTTTRSQLASSAHADNRQVRQPRQQITSSYAYTDSLQSLRFPVLPSVPRPICPSCSKSHPVHRGALPCNPSRTSSYAPRAARASPPEKIMLGKVKIGGKAGFDKLYGWVDKLGAPVNKLSNKLGAEAFWPTTLDLESDKAARILRSFCSTSTTRLGLCDIR